MSQMNTNNHSNYREITIHLSSTRSSEHKIDLSVIVLMEVFEFLHEVLNEPNLSGFDLDLARVRVVIHRVDLEIIGLSLRVRPSDVRVKETVQHDLKIGEKENTGVNKAQLHCKQSKIYSHATTTLCIFIKFCVPWYLKLHWIWNGNTLLKNKKNTRCTEIWFYF